MARTGRPRQDLAQSPQERLEAFCCSQVERIERALHARYGFDYDANIVGHADTQVSPQNRAFVMPQNDNVVLKIVGVERMNDLHNRFAADMAVEVRR